MNNNYFLRLAVFNVLVCIVCQGYSQWKYLGGLQLQSGSLCSAVTSLYVTNCEVFAGTECGLFKSTDGCKTWTRAGAIDSNLKIIAIERNENVFFAGTDTGGIYYSDDDGITWRRTNAFDSTLCMAVTDSFILAGTTRGLQKCRIDDSVWTWVDVHEIPGSIWSVAVKDSLVVAGGTQSDIYYSNDYGKKWNAIDNAGLPSSKVTSITLCRKTIFLTMSSDGIYCSANVGMNWTKISKSAASLYSDMITIDSTVFIATNEGVYATTTSGVTWKSVSSGLGNKQIYTFFSSGSDLYAGSEHDGIWYCPASGFDVPVQKNVSLRASNKKTDLKVYHNFNRDNHPVIDFVLPQSMQVKVSMYDLNGHKISAPVIGYLKEEKHCISMNTSKMAYGVYLMNLNAGESGSTSR
ncbi:MAG TPA: hypothetical protein VHO70_03805 [Chitinispirillaceae bacterium]|nr:hypothetical protein [Chitinispirillaceae bacterium]